MKQLREFIKEAAVNGSYIYTIDLTNPFNEVEDKAVALSRDEYIDAITSIKKSSKKYTDEFDEFVGKCYDAWVDMGHDAVDIPFRFNGKGNVKLGRVYIDVLGGLKQTIGGVTIELGDGSVGKNIKIKTEDQESATCLVWNAMVDDANEDGFDINDAEVVKDIVGSLGVSFPKSWINTFQQQCIALYEFIENTLHEDPKDYKAVRYGVSDSVGSKYAEFVERYIHMCEPETTRISKDNYDPSDIVLYKEDQAAQVLDRLISLRVEDSSELNDKFRELAFDPHIVVGVSLKKTGKQGKAEFFNVNRGTETAKVTKLETDVRNGNYTIITCWGKFNFSGITDPSADPEEGDTIKESQILLTLRSFGKSIAMDCKSSKGPSLGKVPARIWTKAMNGTTDLKHLREMCAKFAEMGKADDKDTMEHFIKWGIKSGPWCLPFVLIH